MDEIGAGAGEALGDQLISSLREGIDILEGRVEPARLHPAPSIDVPEGKLPFTA